ncbi:MAG: putative RNA-binding protein with PIN domain [Phycisphaerales bacterium]|jgi:predicted RNA-binding protein with PIN domain
MELMIDTWNVLHQTGILPPESAGIGIQGLVSLINSSRWAGENTTFVCDGTPAENSANGPNYQTVFTGAVRTADDEIMDRVAASSSSRSILVVTSDREIIRSIKAGGAQHIGSAAFLQALVDDNQAPKKKHVRRPSGLSAELAQKWKREFGIDAEALEELQKTTLPRINAPKPKAKPKPLATPVEKKQRPVTPPEPILPAELLAEARRLLGE